MDLKLFKKIALLFTILILMAASFVTHAQFWGKKQNTLLADEEAFAMTAFIDNDQLKIQWSIANDYYMYRDQFGLKSDTPE